MKSLLLYGLVITVAQGGQPSRAMALQDLTVPTEKLPAGCAVSSDIAGLPVAKTPWIGTDAAVLGLIRERVDAPTMVPDGPPLTTREYARFRIRLAEDIEEGYVGSYVQDVPLTGFRARAQVYGLRYAQAAKAERAGRQWTNNPRASRAVIGPVLVIVHGDGGECFQAVAAHVQRLARE